MSARSPESPIRVGISSCLLGQEVRWDGGHKRDRYITDTLGRFFTWVPVCPEFEAGLGVPRETLRLVGDPDAPRLLFRKSGGDQTERLAAWAGSRLKDLGREDLCGYILKSDSPSCGMERVKVYRDDGRPGRRQGVGLFARALMKKFPLLPVEEEGRLHDLPIRENFIERVFCSRRWKDLVAGGLTRGRLGTFHSVHKLLLLAHSPKHYTLLGRLVAHAKELSPGDLQRRYGAEFMAALRIQATAKKHTNVLHHILGYLKRHLDRRDKAEAVTIIDEFHRGLVPLVVPLTLLKHHLDRAEVPYIREQVYLRPHPRELMLRNHV
ncbi:MAG TPA: DUF523 and DUF1722 domain-containing protein [Candidatus Polarisedimenticolia bacterium]|nr:DUF523 and DUF1722 domain-containing protein [Candidatus Polarisedimenticolia bacterium]